MSAAAALPERREYWTPAFDSLFEGDNRTIPRAARFIFLELCALARQKREGGVLRVPRGMTEAQAIFDLVSGDKREVGRMVPHLLRAEKVRFEERDGVGRVLVIPSWQKCRQRIARVSGPVEADVPSHQVDAALPEVDTSSTHLDLRFAPSQNEMNDSAHLAIGFQPSQEEEKEEREGGDSDPRAHARVASPMPAASPPEVEDVPEPEESGVFLRADAPPAPAPVEAPPDDQPITSFSTALGGELASALGSGIAEVSGVPWVPQSRAATGQKLLAMAKLYPELLGLGRKEFLGRWRALGVGFARWGDRQAEKNPRLVGYPLFGLEDFLSSDGAKHLQRTPVERPKVAKASSPPPPPANTPITPEERAEILNLRRTLGFAELPGFGEVTAVAR